jgi:hypothetical protein
MTRLVSEHDQLTFGRRAKRLHLISRLRRSGLRKTRPFLKTGFLAMFGCGSSTWIRQD